MIGALSGTIAEITGEGSIILDVGNVGYVINLPYRTMTHCKCKDSIRLYIETYIGRDNIPQLYGFASRDEQNCMRMLVKVNGVNYKTALLILDKLTPEQIFSAIINQDKAALKVGGIGDKIVSRIITELSSKVQKLEFSVTTNLIHRNNEAVGALVSLGYDRVKILQVLQKIGMSHSTEETVRLALRELSK